VGGGQMTIVNRTVPLALETLGYSSEQISAIEEHLATEGTVAGAPGLAEEHLPVFDVAVGQRAISPMGHIKMMAAAQPFISGAISKCVVGSTLLATERGLVRIGNLRRDEAPDTFTDLQLGVASIGGARSTDAFYYGGERPVMEVKLRSGHRVTGTPNHRVLIAAGEGLNWRRLDELEPGDRVATKYGDEMWAAEPPRFGDFVPAPRYGSQKLVTVPDAMSEELAFFLGAFAAEGHIARSIWTIRIANADEQVIARLVHLSERLFGVRARVARQPDKCPSVELSSKTLVEFFDYLGTGNGAARKRIPDAVLASPRHMVLSFLEGLTLDSYLTVSPLAKWAICLASRDLLDDLQAVLTNLGVVHSRIEKYNAEYDRSFEEVYVAGRHAQRLLSELRFPERHKTLRAAEIVAGKFAQSTADVVPGITGKELYDLLPKGRLGRSGAGTGHSREFSYLKDVRTQEVSRRSLERVAVLEDVELPDWLDKVLEDNLYFSPVTSVEDAGVQEVFDISVPGPHAFVANGVVNHNTVNLPESTTVEDIAGVYTEGWKLGLKALAIYRDGSKTAQALKTDAGEKKDDSAPAEAPVEPEVPRPVRRRMPRERQSLTHKFSVGGHEGYITAGEYDDGTLGEVFLTDVGKEGSTIKGLMNAFATAISIGLQYGVPLETLVRKFAYVRFEPEGYTGNPEIPFAKSMPDYIMRWLASRYCDADLHEELGILTPEVRARKAAQEALMRGDTASPEPAEPDAAASDEPPANGATKGGYGAPKASGTKSRGRASERKPATSALTDEPPAIPAKLQGLDLGPACAQCGGMMQRTGSCYTCSSCGNNTGCG
jgi:intein/homing endonuclease